MTDTYDHEFTWAWEGTEIKATGTFDKWQSTLTLIKGPDGIYSAIAPLKRGKKIQYKYVVDGVWKHNEGEPNEKDQSGNINNILTVPEEGQAVPRVITATPAVVEEVPVVAEPEVVVPAVVEEPVVAAPEVVESAPVVEEVAAPEVVEEVAKPVVVEEVAAPTVEESKVEEPVPVVEEAAPVPVLVEEEKVVEPVVEEVKPEPIVEEVPVAVVEEPSPVVEEPVVEAVPAVIEPEATPVAVEEPIVEAVPVVEEASAPVVEEAVVEPTPIVEEVPVVSAPEPVVEAPAPVVEEEKKDNSEVEKVAAIAAGLAAATLAAAALAATKVHEVAAAVLEKVPVPEVLKSTPAPIAAVAAVPVEEDSFGASTMAALGLNQASPVLPTQILNEPEANTVAAVAVAEESIPATLVDTPILAALPPVVEAPATLAPSAPIAAEVASPTATIAPPTPVKEAPATPEKKSALENKKTQASLASGPSDASPAVTRSKKSLFGKIKNAFSSPKKPSA